MICFRDKTWCPFKDCAIFNVCKRALTDEVEVDAMVWWKGENPPICQYKDKPECFKDATSPA